MDRKSFETTKTDIINTVEEWTRTEKNGLSEVWW